MIRRLYRPAAALALSICFATPAAAQSLAWSSPPSPGRSSGLAASYEVRLRSAWPQLPGAEGCENGGSETVEGILTRRAGGVYRGMLTRRTRLLFCGAHGAGGDACALVLDGSGLVAMHGTVAEGRALRLTWTPAPEHAAEVQGACGAEFKEAVRRMYLSVRHSVEFDLPGAGSGPRTEALEDYAWIVEVE